MPTFTTDTMRRRAALPAVRPNFGGDSDFHSENFICPKFSFALVRLAKRRVIRKKPKCVKDALVFFGANERT